MSRNLFSEMRHRHSTWYLCTLGFSLFALVCAVAGLIDDRLFQGVSTWNKPFKFSLSIAIYFATLNWFAALMPENYFASTKGKLLTMVPVICAVLEVGYISLQAARGEASHYNTTSALYGTLYSLMGLGAILLVSACLWMGTSILRHNGTSNVWVLSVGLGLIGTFVLGGGFGGYLGSAPGHWVGGAATDAGGLPLVHWSRSGGDLRVAHFFGMHAMQIIPAIGALVLLLQQRKWLTRGTGQVTLVCASIVFVAFCTATFVQAIQGKPLV